MHSRGIYTIFCLAVCSFAIGFLTTPTLKHLEVESRATPDINAPAPLKDVGIQPAFSALQMINSQKRQLESPPDCSKEACLALTFDDGPGPEMSSVLDVLDKHGAAATFYLIGNKVRHYSAIVNRAVLSRHELGNHSWSHPDFRQLSPQQIAEQVSLTQDVIAEVSANSTTFRPPYGFINEQIKTQLILPIVMWNIDPKDWRETNPDVVAAHITTEAKPGAIILLHSTKAHTAEALGKALPDLKKRFKLVTVSQLLSISPDTRGYFFGR